MGGTVALAVRYADGETVCCTTWTNPLPHTLKSKAVLVDKDEAFMRAFIEENLSVTEMDGVTKMHELIPLAPCGYGLNLIDFKTGNFLTMQGHCHFDSFSDIEATGSVVPERTRNFLDLCEAGCMKLIRLDKLEGRRGYMKTEAMIKDADEAAKIAKIVRDNSRGNFGAATHSGIYYSFEVVGTPMRVIDFEDGRSGLPKLKRKVRALGFEIDSEANKLWKSFYDY